MAGKVQVIEKNTGEKIEWRQKGTRLYFGDDDLVIRCDTRQREYPTHVDICIDEDGNLVTGVSGNCTYAAQIDIPGYSYTELEETAAAEDGEGGTPQGGQTESREILPLDMGDVVLTLYSVEELRHMSVLN